MKTYVFTGKVIPERANVQLDSLTLRGGYGKNNAEIVAPEITLSISHSLISVLVKDSAGFDIFLLKNIIENMVRGAVDYVGYINGCGYDLEINQATDETGAQTIFGVKAFSDDPEDGRNLPAQNGLELVYKNIYLRRSLEDLRKAIRYPFDTPFHCFHAVENIRQYFVDTFFTRDDEPRISWEKMNNELRIDSKWLTDLTAAAIANRHGETHDISAEMREIFFRNAWRIIDRFFIYLDQGGKTLDEKKYPFLI
jgi:hypothetical protein